MNKRRKPPKCSEGLSKYSTWVKIPSYSLWNVMYQQLSFLGGENCDATRAWRRLMRMWSSSPLRNYFLPSGYSEETNQYDTRRAITKRPRRLSDSPNVTHLRVAVCVRDRHGMQQNSEAPWADAQSRWGKLARRLWHIAPLLRYHCLREMISGVISGGSGS